MMFATVNLGQCNIIWEPGNEDKKNSFDIIDPEAVKVVEEVHS